MIITGAVYISQLLNVTPTFQWLNIRRNDIDDEGMAMILEALYNKSLTTLEVAQCGLSVKGTVVCKMYLVHNVKMVGLYRYWKFIWFPLIIICDTYTWYSTNC